MPEFVEHWPERNLDTRIPHVRDSFLDDKTGTGRNFGPKGTITLSEKNPALSPPRSGVFLGFHVLADHAVAQLDRSRFLLCPF